VGGGLVAWSPDNPRPPGRPSTANRFPPGPVRGRTIVGRVLVRYLAAPPRPFTLLPLVIPEKGAPDLRRSRCLPPEG